MTNGSSTYYDISIIDAIRTKAVNWGRKFPPMISLMGICGNRRFEVLLETMIVKNQMNLFRKAKERYVLLRKCKTAVRTNAGVLGRGKRRFPLHNPDENLWRSSQTEGSSKWAFDMFFLHIFLTPLYHDEIKISPYLKRQNFLRVHTAFSSILSVFSSRRSFKKIFDIKIAPL